MRRRCCRRRRRATTLRCRMRRTFAPTSTPRRPRRSSQTVNCVTRRLARVRIVSSRVDQVISLPYSALQYRYGVNRVFVVDGDRLTARELKVGERLGERIEILDGVKAGETIAVSDVDKLAEGTKVSVK